MSKEFCTSYDFKFIYSRSEPFIKKIANGTNVAVILIDSQGAKDHESSIQDCVQLFALSTLVSSIQSKTDDLMQFINLKLNAKIFILFDFL